jgi:hypothetical protein
MDACDMLACSHARMLARFVNPSALKRGCRDLKVQREVQSMIGSRRLYVILMSFFTEQKRPMYDARLQWWEKTNHDVIVLNSANSTYGAEDRFSKIRFINVPGINGYGMSRGEAASLMYLQKMVNLSRAEWVVIVTAKYIVPNLTSYINEFNCEVYVQKFGHRGAQNSELFAFRPAVPVFDSLRRYDFSKCEHACWRCGNCFENWLYTFKMENSNATCHFPSIKIDSTWRISRTHGGELWYLRQ